MYFATQMVFKFKCTHIQNKFLKSIYSRIIIITIILYIAWSLISEMNEKIWANQPITVEYSL